MANAHDVAAYILEQIGPLPAMKLQKLIYYSQAWHLVWDNAPLFDERIEAWANGPVVVDIYEEHQGQFLIDSWSNGNSAQLTDSEMGTIDSVLQHYSGFHSQQLSDLTHSERPWIATRSGLSPNERGNQEITHAALHEYYSSL